jgi:hypothetical protein
MEHRVAVEAEPNGFSHSDEVVPPKSSESEWIQRGASGTVMDRQVKGQYRFIQQYQQMHNKTNWTARGSNPSGGVIFRTRPDWPWGPPSPLYIGYPVPFPGIKRPGRGVDHPTLSSAQVNESVELYLYSPSGLSWPVLGWPLPLPGVIHVPHIIKTSAFDTKTNLFHVEWLYRVTHVNRSCIS